MSTPAKDVDAYIAMQPDGVKPLLEKIRTLIKSAAPMAEEYIGYGMPMYKHHGMLVSFAPAKTHLGFYPCNGSTVTEFKEELKGYETSKGAIRLPLDKPLPVTLLKKIIKSRIAENEAKVIMKKEKDAGKEKTKKVQPKGDIWVGLSAPAQRALGNAGIKTLKQLAKYTEADLLKLHGMGKASLPALRKLLKDNNIAFTEKGK